MNLRSGNQWMRTATSCRPRSAGVLCRCFSLASSSFGRYRAASTGRAHGRPQNGRVTLTASTTHLWPHSQTVWERVDRHASRCRPLPYTCGPLCWAAVSSTGQTTGSPGGTSASTIPASTFPSGHNDHLARLNSRW
jgi:hypothetical protein